MSLSSMHHHLTSDWSDRGCPTSPPPVLWIYRALCGAIHLSDKGLILILSVIDSDLIYYCQEANMPHWANELPPHAKEITYKG